MTTPINGDALANSPEEAAFTKFNDATSLEQQFAVLATLLQRKETDYNRANPTESPKNRIVISPDYEVGQLNMTVDLLMSGDAVGKTLVDAIVPHVPISTTTVY